MRLFLRLLIATAVLAVIAVTLRLGFRRSDVLRDQSASYDASKDEEVVLLTPEAWIGRRFPLIDEIDVGKEFAEGDWRLLLYQHDCAHCMDVRTELQRSLHEKTDGSVARSTAFIELPPFEHAAEVAAGPWITGRLSEGRKWFAALPVEITLSDGVVVAACGQTEL